MTSQQVLLFSQSACALVTAMGMQAENKQREFKGEAPAYTEDDFQKVISEHLIGWNDAVTMARGK
jgi:hypothetical protein